MQVIEGTIVLLLVPTTAIIVLFSSSNFMLACRNEVPEKKEILYFWA